MKPAARVGDDTVHGGKIVKGTPKVMIGGRPAARVGDPILCSLHGPGVIVQGSMSVIAANSFASRLGDFCGCAGAGHAGGGGAGSGGGGEGGGGPGEGGNDEPYYEVLEDGVDEDGNYVFRGRQRGGKDRIGEWLETKLGPLRFRGKEEVDVVDIKLPPPSGKSEIIPLKGTATANKKSVEVQLEGTGKKVGVEVVSGSVENETRTTPKEGERGVHLASKGGATAVGYTLSDESEYNLFGYKVNIRDEAGVSASVGRAGEFRATQEDDGTLHYDVGLGGFIPVSILRKVTITPPGAGDDDGDGAGIPNTIATGDATVLIG